MKKHSVTIAGHPTSITLEKEFWDELHDIAKSRGLSISGLITEIDKNRSAGNLSAPCGFMFWPISKNRKPPVTRADHCKAS